MPSQPAVAGFLASDYFGTPARNIERASIMRSCGHRSMSTLMAHVHCYLLRDGRDSSAAMTR